MNSLVNQTPKEKLMLIFQNFFQKMEEERQKRGDGEKDWKGEGACGKVRRKGDAEPGEPKVRSLCL